MEHANAKPWPHSPGVIVQVENYADDGVRIRTWHKAIFKGDTAVFTTYAEALSWIDQKKRHHAKADGIYYGELQS